MNNRSRSSLLRSPWGLMHAFCGATSIGWLIVLAVTFTDRSVLILGVSLAWILLVGLTLFLGAFLSQKRLPKMHVVAVLAVWGLGTLFISNFVVAYWQGRQRLWSGFVFDSRYGWYPEANLKQRPLVIPNGTYLASTDELGHRNSIAYPDSRVLPVILQGDSNAFGFGLAEDETLSAVLNARLPNQTTYNVGVPGFDLNHYYYQYVELSKQFKIKRRIILWNIGNDFTLSALETPNFFRRPYLYVQDNQVQFAPDFRSPFPVQGYGQSFIPPFRASDGLIRTIADDWADLYPAPLIRFPLSRQLIRTYHPKACRLIEKLAAKSKPLELFAPDWMLLNRGLWPEPFFQYSNDLPQLIAELKKQNPRLIFCLFPFREQVIPAEFQSKERALLDAGYTAVDFDPLSFNRYFKSICDAQSIQVIDPTSRFLKVADKSSLFQKNDQHLSAEGIRLCADELISAISK